MNKGLFQNSILLIDKPRDSTSFRAIDEIKKLLHVKKVGHSGTLDKFASGLLVVCTGYATKFTRFFLEDKKRYLGVVKLGVRTDTDDKSGTVLEQKEVRAISREEIVAAVQRYSGEIRQVPPHFSALKINGKRASDIMRKGEPVTLKERVVSIYCIEVVDVDRRHERFSIDVTCSKGTYIRSLARDIGNDLGTGAHLEELRRLESGIFSIDNAITLDELTRFIQGEDVHKRFMVTPHEAFKNFSTLTVTNTVRHRVQNGASFERKDVLAMSHGEKKTYIIYDEDENVIAIADIDIEKWHIAYLNTFRSDEIVT